MGSKDTRNTFSFDESEFGGSTTDAADEALEALEASPTQDPADQEDPELSDVDLRLETADYYRAILKHQFFDTDNNAAKIVDREVRAFIRERLEVLLGIRNPRQPEVVQVQAELPFDEEEVQALKLLASKVLKKPGLVTEPAPLVKKMTAPAPAPKPEVKRKLIVKKIAAPAPAPSTKPKAQPGTRPQQKAISAERPAKPPVLANAETQTIKKADGSMETLVEGDIIEEGGRKYRVVRNELGTLFKKDVSGQVVPPGLSRPMTPTELTLMSERHAAETLNSIDETTGLAIVASLKQ